MSKLDEMIRELCPDGVEYKRFDEVCTLNARIGWQRLTKAEYMSKGDYLLITGTDFTETHEIDYSTCVYVTEERYKQDLKIQLKNGDILITKDGTLGKVAQVKGLEMPATLNGGVFVVRCKDGSLENRFILHYLLSNHFQSVVEQQKTGSTISHLTQTLFSRLMIPIPPLEIQREIVRILDNFTELTAELTARKTQYSFYRSRLLTFDANVEWKTVDEIAEVTDYVANGSFAALKENVNYKHTPDYAILVRTADLVNGFDEENLVYIDKHAYNYLSKSKLYGGEIIINNIGAGVGTTFLCPCLDTYMSLAPNSIMVKTNNNKFYYYWLNSKEGQNAIRKIVSQGSLPKFNKTGFRSIRLPVPPLDVQNRIVNVLDNFEKICSDLNIGLPAEIEARQKQYEYYRDKLLTFKEVAAT